MIPSVKTLHLYLSVCVAPACATREYSLAWFGWQAWPHLGSLGSCVDQGGHRGVRNNEGLVGSVMIFLLGTSSPSPLSPTMMLVMRNITHIVDMPFSMETSCCRFHKFALSSWVAAVGRDLHICLLQFPIAFCSRLGAIDASPGFVPLGR